MAPNEQARKIHDELFPGHVSSLAVTDPELIETFDNFAFDEVLRHGNLDLRIRLMVTPVRDTPRCLGPALSHAIRGPPGRRRTASGRRDSAAARLRGEAPSAADRAMSRGSPLGRLAGASGGGRRNREARAEAAPPNLPEDRTAVATGTGAGELPVVRNNFASISRL
jgi:hypothetical protein